MSAARLVAARFVPSGPGPGGVVVEVEISSDWGVGYCASIAVTNTSSEPIYGWSDGMFTIPRPIESFTNTWNFSGFVLSGDQVTIQPVSYNDDLWPGQTVTGGFCANAASGGGGGGGTNPCNGLCSSPTDFAGPNFHSGNLGTGAACYETTAAISGGNCGNLASGRALHVNGTQVTCNGQNWSSLPAERDGGYCFVVSAGQTSSAYFTTW
jgi:hypothetical protein